jgi:DNA-binding transcriptional regulator GbsR (MarR family)
VGVTEGAEGGGSLREVEDRFIACWGGIAPLWGVSPAHGRIQALLFLSPRPLEGEAIQGRLGISHGSCSTGLNELIEWGVVRRVHVPGARRTRYATDPDGWKWLHRCVKERRRRELQPLQEGVRAARALAEESAARAREAGAPDRREMEAARDRVRAFAVFLDEFSSMVDGFLALGGARPGRLLRNLGKPPGTK